MYGRKLSFTATLEGYISINENFEYGFPHSNALLQSRLIMERCKQHKAARHSTKCDEINEDSISSQDILSQIFDVIQYIEDLI